MTTQATKDAALMPCPFCGRNRARLVLVEGGGGLPAESWVECDAQSCGAKGARFQTAMIYETDPIKVKAITAWNTRAHVRSQP